MFNLLKVLEDHDHHVANARTDIIERKGGYRSFLN